MNVKAQVFVGAVAGALFVGGIATMLADGEHTALSLGLLGAAVLIAVVGMPLAITDLIIWKVDRKWGRRSKGRRRRRRRRCDSCGCAP